MMGPRAKPIEPARLKPPIALARVLGSLHCETRRIAGGNMMAAKTPRATIMTRRELRSVYPSPQSARP
jgi:hypothetical protein